MSSIRERAAQCAQSLTEIDKAIAAGGTRSELKALRQRRKMLLDLGRWFVTRRGFE